MASKKQNDVEDSLPKLKVPREEVQKKINQCISSGKELINKAETISSKLEYDALKTEEDKWDSYNANLLRKLFDTDALYNEYTFWTDSAIKFINSETIHDKIIIFKDTLIEKVARLESTVDRLELYDLSANIAQAPLPVNNISSQVASNKVFVVHGQDNEAKETLTRFLGKFDLEAIILHEQPNEDATIIEKFEKHAAEASFAIVLLTPDDLGAVKEQSANLKPRARQNVILELGYFLGHLLGRRRVCVLYRGEVEVPSDFSGVVYVQLDSAGVWKLNVAKELTSAGYDIDMNKAL